MERTSQGPRGRIRAGGEEGAELKARGTAGVQAERQERERRTLNPETSSPHGVWKSLGSGAGHVFWDGS